MLGMWESQLRQWEEARVEGGGDEGALQTQGGDETERLSAVLAATTMTMPTKAEDIIGAADTVVLMEGEGREEVGWERRSEETSAVVETTESTTPLLLLTPPGATTTRTPTSTTTPTVSASTGLVVGGVPDSLSLPIPSPSSTSWSCPRCTLVNPIDASRCLACDLSGPTSMPLLPTMSEADEDPSVELSAGGGAGWWCPRCTLINRLSRTT